jgi:arginase family enzyme
MFYTSNSFVSYNYPLKEVDVVFLGVPFASSSISKNSIYGPVMVREALKLTEDFIDGVNLFEKLKICDLGDLEVVPGSYELTAKRIKETLQDVLNENEKAFPIFIGGEHSITLPIVEVLKPRTIIQLDAHADLRKDYLENRYSHQAWAYHASKFSKIIQVGVQSTNKEELEVIEEKKIECFSIDDFLKGEIKMEKPVHLTIDVDVFDPSYVETGLPEGSAKPEEIFAVLKKIDCDSLDIVEIADDRLPSKTGFLAAKLIKAVLAKRV